ncbi:MAG: penicillin acylase family protein [Anaerolineae bacterium]|nr:penicillin acylase family protein [Anaerolineae bacterium]
MLRRLVLLVVLAMVVTGTGGITARAQQELTAFTLPGLDGEVTVRWDEVGVPHIYASTLHDLVMVQGAVHAADRWWQMEWFRAQGSGRLAEIGGSALVPTDAYLRTLGLARNAQNDLDHMPADMSALLQAYADGVNAWLAGKTPGDAAMEYTVINQLREGLGALPVTDIQPWEPLHSATWLQVMGLGLSGNMDAEVLRYQVAAQAGEDALDILTPGYDYAGQPLILEPGWTPVPAQSHQIGPLERLPGLENLAALRDAGLGSNNWVVAGSRTASGKPLLANDPHLGIQIPSIWYEIGLHCVEITDACPLDVSGFSFVGTPFVIVGHNRDIAWGVTNVGTDVQDLYLLELNPDNPRQYRYEGEWVDMEVIAETIRPWDGEPVTVEVLLTRFGPVVTDLLGLDQPVALRWAAADPSRNFQAFLGINAARNWDEFQEAVTYFDLAAQNFVYADVEGNIGYIASGRIPLRAEGHDGSLPVPGTSAEFEWQGYVDPRENPRLFNPAAGTIVTANNAVVAPDDFPYTITVDWAYGYRAARIETLLQAEPYHTPDTFAAIQFDNYNSAAALAVPWLAGLDFADERLAGAVAWLGEWDLQNAADSPQAALFNVFWDRFVPLVFDEMPFFEESFNIRRLSLMLDQPDHPLWANAELGEGDPAALAARALGEALDFMESTYGTDRTAWRWGDLHVAYFRAAPIGQLPDGLDPRLDQLLPVLRAIFNRETAVSGGPEIVNATGWSVGGGDFTVGSLPSMRAIFDLSDWDSSRLIHTTGQSGSPQSKHYADMIPLWASGQYHAHHFSAEVVAAHTVETWTLTPAQQ